MGPILLVELMFLVVPAMKDCESLFSIKNYGQMKHNKMKLV